MVEYSWAHGRQEGMSLALGSVSTAFVNSVPHLFTESPLQSWFPHCPAASGKHLDSVSFGTPVPVADPSFWAPHSRYILLNNKNSTEFEDLIGLSDNGAVFHLASRKEFCQAVEKKKSLKAEREQ